MVDDTEFTKLIGVCGEIAQDFPDGLVFIGGIAVYLHSLNFKETEALAETTHDGDFYISISDMADLREIEELTSNRRLSKHQMIKRGFEFDVHTERQAALAVPFDEVEAHSQTYDLFRVACPEHLLVLKMAAYKDRKGSVKGEKDVRDILKIVSILEKSENSCRSSLILPYWTDEEIDELKKISKGPAPAAMTGGNVHEAKNFRRSVEQIIIRLEKDEKEATINLINPDNSRSLKKPTK